MPCTDKKFWLSSVAFCHTSEFGLLIKASRINSSGSVVRIALLLAMLHDTLPQLFVRSALDEFSVFGGWLQ